jgi:hypothetical protein
MILVGIMFLSALVRRRRRIGISLAVGFAVAACIPGYTVTDTGHPVQMTGRLDGELKEDDLGGTPCVWLVGPDGTRTNLLLFDEGRVKFKPLRLLDAAGSTIARVGDTVTAIGPSNAIGGNLCAPDDAFVVDSIIGPGGTWSCDCTESLPPE